MARPRRYNAPREPEKPRPEAEPPQAPEPLQPPEPSQPPRGATPVAPAARRDAFAEPGPGERVYTAVFGRVWLAALAAVSAMSRWTAVATDPVRGEIWVEVGSLLRKTTRPARITIALDDHGLTRVDATFLREGGGPAEGAEPGQIARFHHQLETLLRRDSRA